MSEIGANEAKTHFPKLLERIQKGERFTIIKYGRPVAELVPVTRRDPEAVRRTLNGILSYRDMLRKRGICTQNLLNKNETLRDLAHAGHRY